MGKLGKVLSILRLTRNGAKVTDVKTDTGGGANITSEQFLPPGDDSQPMLGDYVRLSDRVGAGKKDAIGYVDPKNDSKANEGEKRIYARDSNGDLIVEIWLKNDGSVKIENAGATVEIKLDGSIKGSNSAGDFELQASGTMDINGVTIDATGNVVIPGNLAVGPLSKDFLTHIHVGSPTAPTGAVSPTGVIV